MNNKEFKTECSRESKEYYKSILCKRGDISLEKVFEDGFMAGVEYCKNNKCYLENDCIIESVDKMVCTMEKSDVHDYKHRIGIESTSNFLTIYKNGETADSSYCVYFSKRVGDWIVVKRLDGYLNAISREGYTCAVIPVDSVLIPFEKFNPKDINGSIRYSLF